MSRFTCRNITSTNITSTNVTSTISVSSVLDGAREHLERTATDRGVSGYSCHVAVHIRVAVEDYLELEIDRAFAE